MKLFLATTAMAIAMTAGFAQADDDHRCGNVSIEKWMPRATVEERAKAAGIEVRKIEIDDGCYEVKGTRDGQRIEVKYHPETGEQVSIDGDD